MVKTILLSLAFLFTVPVAAQVYRNEINVKPFLDNTYDNGTSSPLARWKGIYAVDGFLTNLTLTGTCTGCGGVGGSDTQVQYNNAGVLDGANVYYVGGLLGINNGSPMFRLDVSGTFRVTGSATAEGILNVGVVSGGGGTGRIRVYDSGAGQTVNISGDTLATYFNTGTNFGISTTSPGTLLSIGDTGNDTINISPTSTSTFGSGINLRTGCFSINDVCIGTSVASGSDYPFTPSISWGALAQATSSILQMNGALISSSTIGRLTAGTITATSSLSVATTSTDRALVVDGSIKLNFTQSSTNGIIFRGSDPWLHDFRASGTDGLNVFMGIGSGNFTMAFSSATTDASRNVGLGYATLNTCTTCAGNLAMGAESIRYITTGFSNVAVGSSALGGASLGAANSNVGIGASALSAAQGTSIGQVGIGARALRAITTGTSNVGIGYYAADPMTTGSQNVVIGFTAQAGGGNSTGNITTGYQANYYGSGTGNIYTGWNVAQRQTTGNYNVMIGYSSGFNGVGSNVTGVTNSVFVGTETGYNTVSSATGNVFLGYRAGYNEAGSNKLYIENSLSSVPLIGGDFATDNVGISSTTPWGKLSVHGYTNDATKTNPLFVVASSTPTATTTHFIITRDGKVGIGTTTPNTTFAVSSGATTTLQLLSTGTQGGELSIEDADDAGSTRCYGDDGVLTCAGSPTTRTTNFAITGSIDGKTIGNTTLLLGEDGTTAVPTGRQFIVDKVIVIPTNTSGVITPPTISIGKTAASYVDVVIGTALTGLTSTLTHATLSPFVGSSVMDAGESLVLRVSTGATATTYTFKVVLIGYLI